VAVDEENDEIVFEVVDTGPGLNPHVIDELESRRVIVRPDLSGSGIGLYLSRHLTSSMRGRIRLVPASVGTHIQVRFKRS
jgi:signal transduction histidine kinase